MRFRSSSFILFTRVTAVAMGVLFAAEFASAAAVPIPIPLGKTGIPASVLMSDEPALFPFFPATRQTTGSAVLIVPPSGFAGNQLDQTSLTSARWLAERGLTAFVLRRKAGDADLRKGGDEIAIALNELRSRAAEFKIGAARIGVMGFSGGAALAAAAAYGSPELAANAGGEKKSLRPAFVALIWGVAGSAPIPADAPPTFLVGSTRGGDDLSGMIDLWTQLRAARVSVDAHFFAQKDSAVEKAFSDRSPVAWPETFYAWVRFQGFLTEQPRLKLQGMVYLDGQPLPQGYVIFTPIDFVGAGPVIARVINSTAGVPIGQFTVPESQGPVAGRYKVDVRQNMNRWLSNSFTGALVNGRNGITPEQAYFGHHRVLAPSIDDQHAFTKVHPGDRQEYSIEFKADPTANNDLKIEVFSK